MHIHLLEEGVGPDEGWPRHSHSMKKRPNHLKSTMQMGWGRYGGLGGHIHVLINQYPLAKVWDQIRSHCDMHVGPHLWVTPCNGVGQIWSKNTSYLFIN